MSENLALLTDLYQLTMAYGYWKSGTSNKEAAFHLFFRRNPFSGGYVIAAGLQPVIDLLKDFHFDESDIEYLATLTGNDNQPLFPSEFLQYLGQLKLECNIDAVPEGTVVFPHEPLLRVTGPIVQCQIIETMLLNVINFQSLIATRAARICQAAGDDAVLEFGLRRAQGVDGGIAASRAAYIGGCAATSNLLAGKRFGIPVKGTHAHSWVMSFPTEIDAFEAYASAMPNNCVFLVDTFDTVEGVKQAITVGNKLRKQGHEMAGIRLDSGDLAWLSRQARQLLDEAGFEKAAIVASNDLDEHLIENLKLQNACISVWGVGTRLVTAHEQPALGGVYKLSAIREPGGPWQPKIKLSEQAIKISNPGMLQVRRILEDGMLMSDVIYDIHDGLCDSRRMVDPMDGGRQRVLPENAESYDLLQPVFRNGELVFNSPTIHETRERARAQLALCHPGIRRFKNPHQFPVGLDHKLYLKKKRLIAENRKLPADSF